MDLIACGKGISLKFDSVMIDVDRVCPKDRTGLTTDGETGLNHRCEGLKAFSHILTSPCHEQQT